MTTESRKFRKKPVVIEAVNYDGTNEVDVADFGADVRHFDLSSTIHIFVAKSNAWCAVEPSSWVIAEPDGTGFYPCTASQFYDTYEAVEEIA